MKKLVAVLVLAVTFLNFSFENSGEARMVFTDTPRFEIPANFPPPVYQFINNPPTNAGFVLGRKLFYDTLLSKDKSIACSNCHQPFAAFANLDHATSHGVDFCFGTRNAPALFNLAWQKEFMWDGGVKHIEFSPLNALTSTCEMANTWDTILGRLRASTTYPLLFQHAFGSTEINSQKMLRAMAQFTALLISANSKYDHFIRKEPGGSFTKDEADGYALFKANCSSCHTEPLFTNLSFTNNGLDEWSEDPGRDTITSNPADRGKFRVPSLRNIALTAPYMHDGRMNTLEEVLNHYTSGMKMNPALDSIFIRSGKPGIVLNAAEKKKLMAFLKTLTDSEFTSNRLFAEQ